MFVKLQQLLNQTRSIDFIAPLALRLYLVPIFWVAGTNKFSSIENTIGWFEHSLGLPAPALMAYLATGTETLGAIFLLIGFAVRWISIPLMVTMFVAATSVHWQNGWSAIAEGSGIFATERTAGAIERLDKATEILKEKANYSWLTENGDFVMLNNGIEFSATYFIMLLALFFIGGGKYASIDYWIAKKYNP